MYNSGQKFTNKDANCVKAHNRIKWMMGVKKHQLSATLNIKLIKQDEMNKSKNEQ